MNDIDNPTKWLWRQLDTILDVETLKTLHAGFDAQNKRYTNAAKIRQCEYEIKLFIKNQKLYPTTSRQYKTYTDKLDRRKARFIKLKNEM